MDGDWKATSVAGRCFDVRDADERAERAIEGSQHIYVGELNEQYRDLDPARHYTLMCASGMRATVAAGCER